MKNREQGKSELTGNANLRLFFAFWFDLPMRQALHKLAGQLHLNSGGRIMRAETLHMTMLFLGETRAERLQALEQAVSGVDVARFDLVLDRFACWQHNGIGYVALEHTPCALSSLASQLRSRVEGAEFGFDRRAFMPHVTLLRKVQAVVAPRQTTPLIWPVREFVLVQSVPSAAGMRYRILQRWPLT